MAADRAKILLVDDHEANLVALSTLLSQDGVEVLQAGSGQQALELLLNHDVALAIIDVHMPIMDGFELAELMRGSQRTQHVPIIFLTGESQDNLHRFRGYQAGAVDFLYKPVEPHVLRSKATIFLDLYRQRQELARQRDRFSTLAEEKARLLRERDEAEERLQRWSVDLERAVNQKTDELRRSQKQLRALATELNLTEQRERKRLATELHDYLAQLLVVVRMKLRQAIPLASGDRAAELLQDADQALTQSLDYTRCLVAELTPPTLKEFGLLESLTWLAAQMQRHGLPVVMQHHMTDLTLPEDQAVLLFQSVRELLFNVLKHAKATEATVTVRITEDDCLEVVVSDDGCGFVSTPSDHQGTGTARFGLFSISERMAAMGGELLINSAPGHGTKATIKAPYRPAHSDCLAQPPAPSTGALPPSTSKKRDMSALPALSAESSDLIGILLVDDHAMVRQGLRSMLDEYDDVAVIGEASNGKEAVESVAQLRPSVVVMDINMPHINGIDATIEIKSRHPEVAVIGLSVQNTDETREAMLQAGATTLISKEAAVDELYLAIRQALAGESTGSA